MADGLRVIQNLQGILSVRRWPVWKRPNGLRIGQRRVPLSVIGIIYESRPNVTAGCSRIMPQSRKCSHTPWRFRGNSIQ